METPEDPVVLDASLQRDEFLLARSALVARSGRWYRPFAIALFLMSAGVFVAFADGYWVAGVIEGFIVTLFGIVLYGTPLAAHTAYQKNLPGTMTFRADGVTESRSTYTEELDWAAFLGYFTTSTSFVLVSWNGNPIVAPYRAFPPNTLGRTRSLLEANLTFLKRVRT